MRHMTSSAAAELLRSYGPAGSSLPQLLVLAREATDPHTPERVRVEAAASVLTLDDVAAAAPSMAEVLAEHMLLIGGRWTADLGDTPDDLAWALADAGFGHVASVERERDAYRWMAEEVVKGWQSRAEAAEAQVAAVRAECEQAEDHGAEDEFGDRWVEVAVIRAALDKEGR